MPSPKPSQFAQHADYLRASQEWHNKLHTLATQVEALVAEDYGIDDAGDLCYNLIDSGIISEDATAKEAAEVTAQYCFSPEF